MAAVISRMQVLPLTCAIGAEVRGVDLGEASRSPDAMEDLRGLLLAHRVLFFRDQAITRAEHVAFARHFGELEDHPVAGSDPEHPGLVRIYKSPDTPNDRYENSWHTDATWRENPPFGCVLRCVECPPVGGDTMWANMALAYERLPAHVKTLIAGLKARHSIEASFGAAMPMEKRLALHAQFPDAEHPVVRTHPETGRKALYVNPGHTERFAGMTREESAPLLGFLFRHLAQPEFTCRFRWAPGSLAFWDNRSMQHNPVNDYQGHTRRMYRISLAGDRPF